MLVLIVEEGTDWGSQCRIPETGSVIVGRSATCDLVLDDERASRQHLRLEVINGRYFVTDMGSRNSTRVNGDVIEQARLYDGDEVKLGRVLLTFYEG